MKKTRTVKRSYETTEIIEIACDLCHAKTKSEHWDSGVSKVDIEMNVGVSYPEYANGTKTSFHICLDCFNKKLIPWFKSQGANPTIEEYER